MKRMLSMLLTLCLLLALMPFGAAAADVVSSGACGDGVTWSIDSDGLLTISGEGSMADYSESYVDGETVCNAPYWAERASVTRVRVEQGVTRIGHFAFSCFENLTEAELPDSLTEIGGYAFQHCGSLLDITLPNSLTTIGEFAFFDCGSLTEIALPEQMTAIEYGVFEDCDSLTHVTIPESITSIGGSAFRGCSSLAEITIPDGVAAVDYASFYGCGSLASIVLPAGIANVGKYAFSGCGALSDVYYYGTADQWDVIEILEGNDPLANAARHVSSFGECGEAVSWAMDPFGLLTISGEGDMTSGSWDTESVKTAVIESGVTSICGSAFRGCAGFESVTIPESVRTINGYAFDGCGSLTDVWYEGAGVDWLSVEISGGNSPLLHAELHYLKPVYVIDSGACGEHVSWVLDSNCVLTIRGEGAMTDYNETTQSPFYEYRNQILTVKVEPGVTCIGAYAFQDCSRLVYVTLPEGMLHINDCAFRYCGNLRPIAFPDGLETIGGLVFNRCKSMTSIVLPESVTKIGSGAFWDTNITSFKIPSGITKLEADVFDNCLNLTSVSLPEGMTEIGDGAFYYCSNLENITLPDGVTKIGDKAFAYCGSLTSIKIPDGVRTIEGGLLWNCSNLTSAEIPESVTRIEGRAFENCSSLSSVTIPGGVTSVGDAAFAGCTALTEIQLPPGLHVMGAQAFSGCSGLTAIAIPSGVTEIGARTFRDCSALESAVIPPTVTQIGESAFAGCVGLREITTYGSIAENAFKNCAALQKAHVLDCREIGGSAFSGCAALAEIDLPDALTSVAAYAFNGTGALKDVYYDDAQSEWDQIDIKAVGNSTLLNAALHVQELDHTHDWGDWIVVTPATRDAEGLQERVCAVCGRTRTRVTPALNYIISQPMDVWDYEDEPCAFRIETRGEELTYQWQMSFDGGQTWENVDSTETEYSCVLTAEMDSARVRCVVTDRYGSSIASEDAYIWIKQPMRLISGPKDAGGKVGETVRFSVDVEGSVGSWKWYCSQNGGRTWKKVSADEVLFCTITGQECDGWLYRCVLKDWDGNIVSTGAARLSVAPEILTQPMDASGTVGQKVTFSIEAEGNQLTYQWQLSKDGGKTWTASSSTSPTATCTLADASRDGWLYRCVVTSGNGLKVTSETAKVIVKPAIKTQPKNAEGAIGQKLQFTVSAAGKDLSYQWQFSKDGGKTWQNSSSKTTTATCTLVDASRDGWLYRCVVTSGNGLKVTSGTAKVIVKPAIVTQPKDAEGAIGQKLQFTVSATGKDLSYQWQFSKDGGKTWLNSSSRTTTATCTLVDASRDGWLYRCRVTSSNGTAVISNTARVTVLAGPTITQQPQDASGPLGSKVYFTVAAEGEGLTYQWQLSKDGGKTWTASSSTTATAACTLASESRNGWLYRCVITAPNGGMSISNTARVIVTAA